MNILLLIDQLRAGGAETHVLTLARALQREGHVVLIASDGGALEEAASDLSFVHPPRSWSGGGFVFRLIPGLFFLRRLHKRYHFDVIHAHTRRTSFLLRLFSLSERLLPRLFLSIRPPYDQPSPAYRRGSLRRMDAPALIVTAHARFSPRYRRLSFWGEETVAVSEDLERHLRDTFGVDPAHINLIPNGIDTSRFCPSCARTACDDDLHLVFASRLDGDCSAAAYALVSLFDRMRRTAAAFGKRLYLTLIGGGSEYEPLQRRVDALSDVEGSGDIHLTGALCDLAPVLQQADVFVGVSRAALEAVSCGVQVILAGNEGFLGAMTPQNFDRAAMGNFCCRGEGKLTEQALYEAFCSLLDQEQEKARKENETLRERLRRNFSGESMAKATLKVYERALNNKRRLRLLVAGYAGCGNLGDDAILRRLIARWQNATAPAALLPSCQVPPEQGASSLPRLSLKVTVAMLAPSPFDGVSLVARKHPVSLLWTILRADALALGGGCLLQNGSAHKNRSLLYYLALLVAARLLGCPTYLVAGGLGPIHGKLPRAMTSHVLRSVRQISVRDETSLMFARTLGVPAERLLREPDPVLDICPAAKEEIAEYLNSLPLKNAFVCVIPRPAPGACHQNLSKALKKLWQDEGVYPLFFAFDTQYDPDVCQKLMQACGVGQMCRVRDERLVAGIFGASRGVISQRLHGLILASVAGVPALSLAYDDKDAKLSSFAREAGQVSLGLDATPEQIFKHAKGI